MCYPLLTSPREIARLGAYTLFCDAFLRRMSELDALCYKPKAPRHCRQCQNDLDWVLEQRASAPLNNLPDLAAHLVSLWKAQYTVNVTNKKCAAIPILNSIADDILRRASSWSYESCFQAWHDIGRDLARAFYRGCPDIQPLLGLTATLRFEECPWSKGMPLPPYYHPSPTNCVLESGAHIITVNCGVNYGYELSLAYPYFFMHEYVAHIYTLDDNAKNLDVHDSWMHWIATAFISRYEVQNPETLAGHQISAPEDDYFPKMSDSAFARKYATTARRVRDVLLESLNSADAWALIQQWTWEMVSWPKEQNPKHWPSHVLNRLHWVVNSPGGVRRLKDLVADRPDLFTLSTRLPIETSSD